MAEYTYEVLVEYGAQAIEDIRHKRLDKGSGRYHIYQYRCNRCDREHHEKLLTVSTWSYDV
ncbi:MAG: hypothetical protein ACLTSC_14055 [Mediterraneibacter faecis]